MTGKYTMMAMTGFIRPHVGGAELAPTVSVARNWAQREGLAARYEAEPGSPLPIRQVGSG